MTSSLVVRYAQSAVRMIEVYLGSSIVYYRTYYNFTLWMKICFPTNNRFQPSGCWLFTFYVNLLPKPIWYPCPDVPMVGAVAL